MIDKRLFQIADKKILIIQVILKIAILLCSISIWFCLALLLQQLLVLQFTWRYLIVIALLTVSKILLINYSARFTDDASSALRHQLREKVLAHAVELNTSSKQMKASKLTQLASDGIEQLEIYYANFLPQLFYCCFGSIIIFIALSYFAIKPALVMLICVPLIPIIIMSVMKIAKRILGKYWQDYTDLGETFTENLHGFTTLAAYGQDGRYASLMNQAAEKFRKATMSLLSMQLNSIGIMDIISYAGAGLGIGLALIQFHHNELTFPGLIMFILLSAEFFLPMRALGSLFHVAMNGISSCKLIFDYLDEQPISTGNLKSFPEHLTTVATDNLKYIDGEKIILQNVKLSLKRGQLSALAGNSGAGKSTLGKLLTQALPNNGQVFYNRMIANQFQTTNITTYVSGQEYIYPESILYNLVFTQPINSEYIWQVLEQVDIADFIRHLPAGLDTILEENGRNLSGGQRQRLILARSILKDADFYVFDEITSGVDKKSAEIIHQTIKHLAQNKIVLLISHRLYQLKDVDHIYLMQNGKITDYGSFTSLAEVSPLFKQYLAIENQLLEGTSYE